MNPRELLVGIIYGIIIFMIILAAIFILKDKLIGESESQRCSLSVLAFSKTSKIVDQPQFFSGVQCPSIDLELKQKTASDDIRTELTDCWKKFGQGRLNPVLGETVYSDLHCFRCANIKPEKDIDLKELKDSIKEKDFFYKGMFTCDDEVILGLKDIDKGDKGWIPGKWFDTQLNCEGIKEWEEDILRKDKTYYLMHGFVVDRNVQMSLVNLYDHEVTSKMFFVERSNAGNVCFIEN